MSDRHIVYLTGKVPNKYTELQIYFESQFTNFQKSSLGMHCTVLAFDSKCVEDRLVNIFEEKVISKPILTYMTSLELFDKESVVLKLKKTSYLEKVHYLTLSSFSKYDFLLGMDYYRGKNYAPHLTLGHTTDITTSPNKVSDILSYVEILGETVTLDRLILAKRTDDGYDWRTLSEKKLIK